MTTGNVRQVIDVAALNALINGPSGGVVRDLLRRGLRVQTAAKRKCPANFGRLRGSITPQLVFTAELGSKVPVMEVGTNVRYALAVHNGTGIYGPRATPIRPVKGRYLVFTIRGGPKRNAQGQFIKGSKTGNRVIFAKEVKGQKGVPYLKDALDAARG
jgi:hypothetical protein